MLYLAVWTQHRRVTDRQRDQWRIHGGGGDGGDRPPPEAEGVKNFYESRKIFCALTRAGLINHTYTTTFSRRNNSA